MALIGLLLSVAPFSCSSSPSDSSDSSDSFNSSDADTDAGREDGTGGDAGSRTTRPINRGRPDGGALGQGGSAGAAGASPAGAAGAAGAAGSPPDEPCTPTGPEECDGIDNDCNDLIDDGLGVEVRRSSDGFLIEEAEPCDRPDDADDCALGHKACQAGGVVCDESDGRDPATGQGGEEICDGEDNNCDGQIDEGFGVAVLDAINQAVLVPAQPCDGADSDLCTEGFLQCNADGAAECSDDTRSNAEVCDGTDNDCNPETLEDDLPPQGSCSSDCGTGQLGCVNGEWRCNVPSPTDPSCSDASADLDCNGVPDHDQENVEGSVRHYLDEDGDGYPAKNTWRMYCDNGSARGKYKPVPSDYSQWDCCDSDADAHPNQTDYFDKPNDCGSWDYDCKNGGKPKPTVEGTGVPHNQCFRSCVDAPPGGRSGWDEILCGTCDPACGKVCPHVIMSQCIFPPTADKKVLCR